MSESDEEIPVQIPVSIILLEGEEVTDEVWCNTLQTTQERANYNEKQDRNTDDKHSNDDIMPPNSKIVSKIDNSKIVSSRVSHIQKRQPRTSYFSGLW